MPASHSPQVFVCNHAEMSKIRRPSPSTTRLCAPSSSQLCTSKRDSRVVEALRRDHIFDDIAEIWAKVTPAGEEVGMRLATEGLRAVRNEA